ncbi:hypothetical protein [Roseimaritima multifibrata]|nr:hypothetical protein [Roseimaritima multifibrata]
MKIPTLHWTRPRKLTLALAAVTMAGCAQWKATPPSPHESRGLPAASVAADATVMDIIFWPLPDALPASDIDAGADPLEILWRDTDELAVDAKTRTALQANGLRAGRIDHIEQLLDRIGIPQPDDPAQKLLQQAAVSSDIASSQHRLPFRDGQQEEFAIRQTSKESQSVVIRKGKDSIGRTLQQPQFLLTLQARPSDDGRVRIRTWPRIEHGPFRQSYVSTDQVIRTNMQREQWVLRELLIDTPLDQNQSLLIAPLKDPFGLGKQILTAARPDGTTERVAILIRVARKPQPAL